jgi:hypothetical protein
VTLLDFMRLFPEFRASSWDGWRDVLAGLTAAVREFYVIAGRGSGKSRVVALLACWFATRAYVRVPGECIYIGVFAPDRRQARVTFRYARGLLRSVPELAALIVSETQDAIELSNGVTVEVITASIAAPRGRAYALAIVEEAAFLSPDEQSAAPDIELLRALRPALARVPDSLLAVVSSPYARRGILYDALQRHQRAPADDVLVVQAATADLNPTFDARAIARAYEDDPAAASSEYGAEFRTDIESFLSRDAIAAVVVPDRHELPPMGRESYRAFVDPSGGSNDAMTLAIGHSERRDGTAIEVLDLLREVRPPFSPEATVRAFAEDLRRYRVTTVHGDRYAGEWPREQFRSHGIHYRPSERAKSDLYRDTLPLINSARVELLDHPRLVGQLVGLERRTARGGRDSIDHPPSGHDDLANAACGVLALAATAQRVGYGWAYSPWI